MRFLLVSDVHGNRFGLEAVLQATVGQYDRVLCLGDVVGYGAHPNQCCELLRSQDALCLMGNHDAAALGRIDINWFNPSAMAAVLWTRQELTSDNRSWLDSLHPTLDGREWGFGAVHASLRQPIEEYIVSAELAQANFAISEWPVCFYGHTHVAECYRCLNVPHRRYAMEHAPLTYGGTVSLESEWKYLLNPGSCGQPRDNNPQARYAIFDTEAHEVEVFALDYDWQSAREAILAAGLPRVLGDRLAQGR
jgi:predicted phosphodiesterase